ncbi:MAG: Lipid II flippase FtsW [Chlamydiae bacterium]|nr:Lipid II flippase FtsW [Chlamydiota bacterium]
MRLLLLIGSALLFALGLVMVYNTTSAEILDRLLEKNTHHALFRQLLYAFLGGGLAILVWRVGYLPLLKLSPLLLIGLTLLLVLVFVPGVGKVRNGAHRWIGFGGLTLQPSEFVKYLIPFVYIEWFSRREGKEVGFFSFGKIVALLACPMFLVMIEPDNGTTAVIGATLIPLFFLTKIRFTYWALPVLLLLAVGSLAAFQLPYVRGRLEVYLHPELDPQGKGHQPHQAKIAAGSGKFLGRGPGGSLQKLTYLPEAQNDYIAAIFAEEFGFLGVLVLILLYMLWTYGGMAIAFQAPTNQATLLAATITFLLSLQAFLNLGVVSGLLPSKGVNLPFFSQGGTSLIANMAGLGLLLSIHEKKDHISRKRDGGSPLPSPSSS